LSGTAAFIYSDDFLRYQFGPGHPFQPVREKLVLDTLSSLGTFDGCGTKVVAPGPVDMPHLHAVHPPEHVEFVRRTCQESGLLDAGDTPGNPELFEGALSAVGGTLRGVQGIMGGEFDHAFNPAGGLHHAHATRASGFCVFNDIAVAVRALQRDHGLERIAVVDIDGHHGDGTQDIFYQEGVLTMSLHRYGNMFFPGTGGTEERGEGEGKGLNINIPLPRGTDDNLFLKAYRAVVLPALHAYQPQFIIHQFGADGHYLDPLVGLGLTTRGYQTIARITHEAAHQLCDGRYMVVGGGGYDIDATRRAWTIVFATLSGAYADDSARMAQLHDKEALVSDHAIASQVMRTIEEQEERSLPLLEKLIRYA
jgi:acetoin utilization protein AcuC